MEADHVTMEIDPTTQINEKLSVYLFADGTLIQEELLSQGLAYILIRNPEYVYEEQMEKAETKTTQTMAKPTIEKNISVILFRGLYILEYVLFYG